MNIFTSFSSKGFKIDDRTKLNSDHITHNLHQLISETFKYSFYCQTPFILLHGSIVPEILHPMYTQKYIKIKKGS